MPVDLYVGGSEHAVLHLLYARFWHKVLYDAGVVSTPEPFAKLVHQGMILGELEFTQYVDARGAPVSAVHVRDGADVRTGNAVQPRGVDEDDVEKQGDRFVLRSDSGDRRRRARVQDEQEPRQRRESRRHRRTLRRRLVPPLRNVHGPARAGEAVEHARRRRHASLLEPRVALARWARPRTTQCPRRRPRCRIGSPRDEQWRVLHQTIAKVTEDLEALRFNTAIAALMELVNAAYKWPSMPRRVAEPFVLLLAPLAPHIAEELWQRLGHAESLAYERWPEADPQVLARRCDRDPGAGQRQGSRQDHGARRGGRAPSHRDRARATTM